MRSPPRPRPVGETPLTTVIEESLRRDLKLDVLDELWANATMSEAQATELGVEAQHQTRARRRASGARRR